MTMRYLSLNNAQTSQTGLSSNLSGSCFKKVCDGAGAIKSDNSGSASDSSTSASNKSESYDNTAVTTKSSEDEQVAYTGGDDTEETTASVSQRTENGYDCPDCDDEATPYEDEWQNGARTHLHDSEADESNWGKNKSSHYYDNYVQHTDLMHEDTSSVTDLGTGEGYTLHTDYYQTFTTSPEITEEEAANGVVSKETEHYSYQGLSFSLLDPHYDKFTYDDGTTLTNYYDNGHDLSRQVETMYADDVDYNNLQDGDKKYTVTWVYNDDGTYYKMTSTSTYEIVTDENGNEIGQWVYNCVASDLSTIAYDADGNAYYSNTDEWEEITGGHPGIMKSN